MANYREIVTKAVISKGKKTFTTSGNVTVENPSTVLGCWIINHNFSGSKSNNQIVVNGSYDINIWYSYDNDTKTDVIKKTETYSETIKMRDREETSDEEIIVRSLKQPSCTKVDIDKNSINYVVEKELGIELVGNIKVKIEANEDEDPWDEIIEDSKAEENIDKSKENDVVEKINSLDDNFIEETI